MCKTAKWIAHPSLRCVFPYAFLLAMTLACLALVGCCCWRLLTITWTKHNSNVHWFSNVCYKCNSCSRFSSIPMLEHTQNKFRPATNSWMIWFRVCVNCMYARHGNDLELPLQRKTRELNASFFNQIRTMWKQLNIEGTQSQPTNKRMEK